MNPNLEFILNCLVRIFKAIFGWLNDFNYVFPFYNMIFAIFLIGLVYRYLLLPLFVSSGSDSAKKKKGEAKEK